MKANIEERANTAIAVLGAMGEVLTPGAYLERDTVVKMTLVTTVVPKADLFEALRSQASQARVA